MGRSLPKEKRAFQVGMEKSHIHAFSLTPLIFPITIGIKAKLPGLPFRALYYLAHVIDKDSGD